MDFHHLPYNHHQTAFITQPSINMSNPDDLKSIFEEPSDIKMEDLDGRPPQAQMYPPVETIFSITQVYLNDLLTVELYHGTHCDFPAFIE